MTDEKKPVSNKPVQVSNAPPPISPLRGGFIPRKSESDRVPRWNKWRLMPEVEEWEAVALSLNIEPEKIKYERNACMEAAHPFDEGEEFIDRLMIIKKHASNRTHFPTPCFLNMANWYQCEVRLDEFAAWCIHVGFEIPPELSALAKVATQAAPLVEAAPAKPEAVPVITPSGDGIPGKMPQTNIGKLAIKAAWQIECSTNKQATAKQVIEKLQAWTETEPELTETIPHGVKWETTKGKVKPFDVEACAKALETWQASRA